jgi:NADPH:quinone reductase
MRAALMTAVGGPDVLELADVPEPEITGERQILERAGSDFDAGDLRVQVGATFPLEQAADAHRALELCQVIGKVVLVME